MFYLMVRHYVQLDPNAVADRASAFVANGPFEYRDYVEQAMVEVLAQPATLQAVILTTEQMKQLKEFAVPAHYDPKFGEELANQIAWRIDFVLKAEESR